MIKIGGTVFKIQKLKHRQKLRNYAICLFLSPHSALDILVRKVKKHCASRESDSVLTHGNPGICFELLRRGEPHEVRHHRQCRHAAT